MQCPGQYSLAAVVAQSAAALRRGQWRYLGHWKRTDDIKTSETKRVLFVYCRFQQKRPRSAFSAARREATQKPFSNACLNNDPSLIKKSSKIGLSMCWRLFVPVIGNFTRSPAASLPRRSQLFLFPILIRTGLRARDRRPLYPHQRRS